MEVVNDDVAFVSDRYKREIEYVEVKMATNQLLYYKSILNVFKHEPHCLYGTTELRTFWDKHLYDVYDLKNRRYSQIRNLFHKYPFLVLDNKNDLADVKKLMDQFLVKYYEVSGVYKNAMMQTEFKLQLVLGSDVAKYILSFVHT